MVVAHVSDCYLPRVGGIEALVSGLAHAQAGSGDRVHVITATRDIGHSPGHSGEPAGPGSGAGVEVHRITFPMPLGIPAHPWPRQPLVRLLSSIAPDVVHVHAGVLSPFAWAALRVARDRHLPTVIGLHSVWGRMAVAAAAASDHVTGWSRWPAEWLAPSEAVAAPVRRAARFAPPITLVPHAVDAAQWSVPHDSRDGQALRVVSTLRFVSRKRPLALLRVFRHARARVRGSADLRLTLVGDGPHLGTARAYAVMHGLGDAVRFTGRLPHHALRALYAASDVYFQASINEAFGIAALEARAAGLPVVARADSGTSSFIRDGIEGRLASDDPGLSTALADLAVRPETWQRIAEHNREHPPGETWSDLVSRTSAAYDRARQRGHASVAHDTSR